MKHTVIVQAPAKINLTLDIKGRRDDGYHDMEMVMQSIDLCNVVHLQMLSHTAGIRPVQITSNVNHIPFDQHNLASKAVAAFMAYVGHAAFPLAVHLQRVIPTEAGLAGGSADAAAVIVGLNALLGYGLGQEELCRIGVGVGADVPFCIVGGTQLATGIGDVFTPLPGLPDCHIVVAKPKAGSLTEAGFRLFDRCGPQCTVDTKGMVAALESGDLRRIGGKLCNVLEPTIPVKDCALLKELMLQRGAVGAAMTGSGTAVYGLFAQRREAVSCLRQAMGKASAAFIAKPLPHGAKVIG